MSSPSFFVCEKLFPSLYPSSLLVFPASSAARVFKSGALCWCSAPEIGIKCRCSRPFKTCITRYYTSTLARICSRRQRLDTPIILEPWCELKAMSPPPSPVSVPQSWSIGPSVCKEHLRLWLPLLLEEMSLMSWMISSMYWFSRTDYRRAIFLRNFWWMCHHPPPSPVVVGEGGGVKPGGYFSPDIWIAD